MSVGLVVGAYEAQPNMVICRSRPRRALPGFRSFGMGKATRVWASTAAGDRRSYVAVVMAADSGKGAPPPTQNPTPNAAPARQEAWTQRPNSTNANGGRGGNSGLVEAGMVAAPTGQTGTTPGGMMASGPPSRW